MTQTTLQLTAPVKVWDKTAIKTLLVTNDKAAIKALNTIYARQTEDEKSNDTTKHSNSVGFNAMDAEILSSFAKFYSRTGFLTEGQMKLLKRKITKYWKQLLQEVEAKGLPVSYK